MKDLHGPVERDESQNLVLNQEPQNSEHEDCFMENRE